MGPNRMLPYVEGARNCIRFANVQEREEVLILAEPDAELAAIEVISLCCRENEANVLVLYKEKTEFGREISPVIAEAIKAADTVFDLGYPIAHTKAGVIANMDYGTKIIMVRSDAELFTTEAAKFPLDLWYTMGRLMHRRIRENPSLRITDSKGTDFRMEIDPRCVGGFIGPIPLEPGIAVPGYVGPFPPGTTLWGDMKYSANGEIFLDGAYDFGNIAEPIKWTIENGWVVDFQGYGAKALSDLARRSQNANRFGKMGFGMNPKVIANFDAPSPQLRAARLFYSTRRAGTFFCSMGSDALMGGKDWSPQVPIYAILLEPTVFLDDEIFIENGHLRVLEDPSIREKAREFGDPRKLLEMIGS
jgi:leucyl aminopeptidase (aminopeptidase T)